MPDGEPRFLVDAHLGSLAKGLRALGYDTVLARTEDDDRLVRRALAEDRLLLTRDMALAGRRLATRGPLRALYLHEPTARGQLAEVVRALGLSADARFSRCLVCNALLRSLAQEEVAARVPPFVFATQTEFRECPLCARVFWRGTHWRHMTQELAAALGREL